MDKSSNTNIAKPNLHSQREIDINKEEAKKNKEKLLTYIRERESGNHTEYVIRTVYGDKPLFYADY